MIQTEGRIGMGARRARRAGWWCVLLAVGANALLFFTLALTDRTFGASPEEITLRPVEVFVPPQSPEPPRSETNPLPLPGATERTPLRIEPMKAVPRPIPMIPRLPAETEVAGPEVWPEVAEPEPAGPAPAPLQMADVDRRAIPISTPHPTFPSWARARRLEARVTIEFTVDKQGRVVDVRVRQVKGNERFGTVAANAVRKWRYRPARAGGRPVPERKIQPFRFTLKQR